MRGGNSITINSPRVTRVRALTMHPNAFVMSAWYLKYPVFKLNRLTCTHTQRFDEKIHKKNKIGRINLTMFCGCELKIKLSYAFNPINEKKKRYGLFDSVLCLWRDVYLWQFGSGPNLEIKMERTVNSDELIREIS